MNQIFLSYRRDDSEDATARINDWLDMYFGGGADVRPEKRVVFRDIDSLRAGRDFSEDIKTALDTCRVAIVVIGPQWATIGADEGTPRIVRDGDYVRMELARLMERRVPIFPVLLDSTKMPRAQQLPPDVRGFEKFSAVKVRAGRGFPADVKLLAQEVADAGDIPFHDYPSGLHSYRSLGLVSSTVGHMSTDPEVLNQIETAKDLLIVMNDGRGFLDNRAEMILSRTTDSSKKTRIVFLHPDSDYVRLDAFLQKVRKEFVVQIGDIQSGYVALQAKPGAASPVEIRGSREIFPLCYMITESYAFMSPYLCRRTGTLPIFRFAADDREPGSLYPRLRKDAEDVFDSATPLNAADFSNVRPPPRP